VIGALAAWAAQPELTIGAKTNPAGLAILGDLWVPVADGAQAKTEVGPGLGVYFLWYEPALRVRQSLLGGFLVGNLWAGAEPGIYLRAEERDGPRVPAVRALGRARLELNLRNDLLWLYSRSTGVVRTHPFAEYDPFRDAVFVGVERSGEQSVALMASPSGSADRKLWFYAEVTGEAAVGVGWTDRVLRGGVIGEQITPALSADLDLYWSFMDTAVGGPGVLVVVWVRP
jgi:hypothetical protein